MAGCRHLMAVSLVLLLIAAAIPAATAQDNSRHKAAGFEYPEWKTGDFWKYRSDAVPGTRVLFGLVVGHDVYMLKTEMRATPNSLAVQSTYTVTYINEAAQEYAMDNNTWTWENMTWQVVVTDTDGDPAYTVGEVLYSGTATSSESCTGSMRLDSAFLGVKRESISCNYVLNGKGGINWEEDVTTQIMKTIELGYDTVLKPTWDNAPMMVGDTWSQVDSLQVRTQRDYTFTGDISGSGSGDVLETFTWNFNWLVSWAGPRTVPSAQYGTTLFPDAAKVIRTGDYGWEKTESSTTTSGHVDTGQYEYFYACDGDNYDSGWFIDLNSTFYLVASNHVCFHNTAPQFVDPPPAEITINSEEYWRFRNGVDYVVMDPDPGEAGRLTYSIKKSLGTNSNVLSGLVIEPDTGDIMFVPPQTDVADGYNITINVTDHYEKGPLSNETVFVLNIKNKNHMPSVNASMLEPVTMNEGSNYTADWKLTDAFRDPDLAPNPLMGNRPYDPYELLRFSATGQGALEVRCENGKFLEQEPSCQKIHLVALDMKFPRDVTLNVTIKGTDNHTESATGTLTVNVRHINHAPGPVVKAPPNVTYEANTVTTIELTGDFKDPDIGDPNYLTDDLLLYSADPGKNITVTVTGVKAKLVPAQDWCGSEDITFWVTDRAGARAKKIYKINVQHCGPQFELVSYSPKDDPVLQEGGDSGTAYPGAVTFSIDIKSNSTTVLFKWKVVDKTTGKVYEPSSHDPFYRFETSYVDDFANGRFFGGDSTRTYTVTSYVTDGRIDVDVRTWLVSVRNTDRRPTVSGVSIFKVLETGASFQLPKVQNHVYNIQGGFVYTLDAAQYIDDEDEHDATGKVDLSRLTVQWDSASDGIHATGTSIKVISGTSVNTTFRLKVGEVHHLTLKVTDKEGASAELNITLIVSAAQGMKTKVREAPWNVLPLILLIAAVVAVVAYNAKRSR